MFNFFNNASPLRAAVTPRGLRGALGPARLWLAMACLVPVWLAIPWCGCFNSAQGAEPNLLSGEALRAHLDDKIGATWAAAPLRQALYDLAQSQHIAVLLDRRIDPGQALDLTLQDAPLGQGLEQLATREKLGECLVGSVLYFGPPQTAARLRTVAALRHEEIGALPLTLRPKFLHSRSWKWDDLATPRELLGELGREVGARFVGGEQIPHDLWAGGNWPAES
ncbi:MAG TPA: hypothetical protein VFE24_00855, partial [Pirellulales bacterium]|nr:hypothetical protein [Pirellulales bacterium]